MSTPPIPTTSDASAIDVLNKRVDALESLASSTASVLERTLSSVETALAGVKGLTDAIEGVLSITRDLEQRLAHVERVYARRFPGDFAAAGSCPRCGRRYAGGRPICEHPQDATDPAA